MTINLNQTDAVAIASAIKTGKTTTETLITKCLQQIYDRNQTLNCFTAITAESALNRAKQIDKEIAQGKNPGLLAGVPFAVKNLYDIAGFNHPRWSQN